MGSCTGAWGQRGSCAPTLRTTTSTAPSGSAITGSDVSKRHCGNALDSMVDTCNSDSLGASRVMWASGFQLDRLPCVICNRRWIVVLFPCFYDMHIWKVCGDGIPSEPQVTLCGLGFQAAKAEFSRFCDDVAMVFPFGGTLSPIPVVDLEASFNAGSLVVTSTISCGGLYPVNVMWLPDGTMCSLHSTSTTSFFLVNSENHNENPLPESLVTPIGKNHFFSAPGFAGSLLQFSVYQTGDLLSPSLSVPCTWASAGCSQQTGLILSTKHDLKSCSCVVFSLHEGISGFHFGCFCVPHQLFLSKD
ncbi:hypothetical protein Pelo_18976 [Pelomyxa schiedti]|nr:hypothetical protein Pelo_18976 [Pelomyxa schiedti]